MPTKWYQPSPRNKLQPIPWLHPDVIAHLESLIQPDWDILEHGSGGSTLWFAERAKSVTAFESDPDWQAVVKKNAPENVRVVSQGTYRGVVAPDAIEYDLLLIDGVPVGERCQWITDAPTLVRPGGWVVLDNCNRPEYAREREALQKIAAEFVTINGNEGQTMYLMTEFYRMPEVVQEKPKAKRKSKKKAGA
jgi:predicted O-methyltransferase YrrM